MKKSIAALLITSMLAAALTGCGDKPQNKEGGANDAATSGQQTTAEQKENTTAQATEPSADQEESLLPAMTQDNITLTFAQWGLQEKGEPEVMELRMAKFMEDYPNIKVEAVTIDQSTWDDTLYSYAAAGTLPDVFGVFSVTNAVMSEWALEVSEYFDNDPDTDLLYPAVEEMNKINGKRYSMPWAMFPHIVMVNKTLFDKYNVTLPSYDWTWEEFTEIVEKIAHPEEFYFGTSNPLYADLFPAMFNGGQGKFGWDGTSYHFDQVWVDAMNLRYRWQDSQVLEWASEEDKEKFLGDPQAWPPGYGRVACHLDWPWSIANFEDVVTPQTGCEFLYYPIPKGPTGQQLAIVDNTIISASTEYPREAWELQKYMTWGPEAAMQLAPGYQKADAKVSRLPVITYQEAWDSINEYTDREDLKEIYSHLTDVVPSNWQTAPGWAEFDAWMAENDINGQLDRREITPAEIAPELEKKANELAAEWIANMPE